MAIADLLESKFAVNPFGEVVQVDRKPEAVGDVKLEISEKVNFMFEKYKKAYSHFLIHYEDAFEYMSHLKLDVLSPVEIDLVLQLIAKTNLRVESHIAGAMISRLINDSYKSGNNNFTLTTNDCNINNLFNNLIGIEKNSIIATVFGDVGWVFGYQSEHCIFDIKGNASMSLGVKSKHGNYTIHGDAGSLGKDSEYCTYNICGIINEQSCDEVGNSTFKVRDQELYKRLCENLHSSNKIQLVDNNENIIMEKRKRLP